MLAGALADWSGQQVDLILTGSAFFFGRVLGAGLCFIFQVIGLALQLVEFSALLCHAYKLPQADEIG